MVIHNNYEEYTFLDENIALLTTDLECVRAEYRSERNSLEERLELLEADYESAKKIKHEKRRKLKMKRKKEKETSHLDKQIERLTLGLEIASRQYKSERKKLEYRLEVLNTDYESTIKNPRQRLETLIHSRERRKEMVRPILLTLTYRINQSDEHPLDITTANFYQFIDKLSRPIFKHAYRRHGKKVGYIAAYEKKQNVRLHIHAVLECPKDITERNFKSQIESCWKKGTVKFENTSKYHTSDPGDWINYFFKNKTKDLNGKSFSEYQIH